MEYVYQANELMKITESDLCYSDYQWDSFSESDPRISGKPGKTIVDRDQGHELVYIINCFIRKFHLTDKSDARKIEIMIREEMPETIKRQDRIMAWIEENW